MENANANPAGTIRIRLLGEFSLYMDGIESEARRVDSARRANRQWSLIAYLALNRSAETSTDRLIELFWTDDATGDPQRALWLAISRCRTALGDLGIPDARNLIIAGSGGYRWNPSRPTVIDVETFEKLSSQRNTAADRLECTLRAIDIYQGDFWTPSAWGGWAVTRQIYYKTIFMQLCQEAVLLLWEAERWEDVVRICRKAIAEDPGAESFSVYFMRALTVLGQPQKALEHYEYIKNVLKNDYMVEPQDELELARSEAAQRNLGERISAETVAAYLKPTDADGAFYCDYPIFRRIVELESREQKRSGKAAQLVVLDMLPEEKGARMTTDMNRMERILNAYLRAGDPYTRLSTTQFLILLPGASSENVDTVMTRVENAFRRTNTHSKARIRYHSFPLDSLSSKEKLKD
ncbi:MAG: BTAD domain-containing putative transcriptional regulator [Clostridiaceae bacterium]|nr:BTAD domain-containing putative transcriptional regulator [Clostridiaceae bacterium]